MLNAAVLLLSSTSLSAPTQIDLSAGNVAKGRAFDGVGALSGGGATSVLLQSYPAVQRDEILDYLFKPGFGASLNILKVEIGGDGDSTEGSESSHAHIEGVVDCARGYEWPLMKQARARNPSLQLYGLPWAFPHWLGAGPVVNGTNPLLNISRTGGYIADWLQCARDAHGVPIDIIGVWNEMDDQFAAAGVAYIKGLRQVLDARGFESVRIIAGDVHSWAPEDQLLTDPVLKNATAILCRHYPSTHSDAAAQQTGLPLWSSEDYAASNFGSGGRCEARILNQNWVVGLMTATINWNLISSYYAYQQWSDDGFAMTARSPWSGHYEVQPPLWASAHTSQFATPGMFLLPNGTGSGFLPGGGSYVTYYDSAAAAENGGGDSTSYIAIVLEKVVPNASSCGFSSTPSYDVKGETWSFQITNFDNSNSGGVDATIDTLYVWRSNFANGVYFERDASPLKVDATTGLFSVVVNVDDLITLTSDATRGSKGAPSSPIPPASDFPLKYSDDFESYAEAGSARYFTSMSGVCLFSIHI